uniref:Reverse transcriptase domain-containing protein n=1 Tax=Oreochromis aureus TaxID=47969 RepID=A0AAZ1XBQ8_OREAU
MLRTSRLKFQNAAKTAKTSFLSKIILANDHNPHTLFKIFNSVVNPSPDMSLIYSQALCERFQIHFLDKITSLKSSLPLFYIPPHPECTSTFHQFEPVSLLSLKRLVVQMNNTNTVLDILPSHIAKDCFDVIGPSILFLMNFSLLSGCVPLAFKHAVVHPILKKRNSDCYDLSNYRPISKLSFLSKILERLVLSQLQVYLDTNHIAEKFQSAFKPLHSTETALVRVLNDILVITDTGRSMVLVLLDLSSAFDMVDHNILLLRLEHTVGIRSTVLNWFKSYLADRSFSVNLGTFSSSSAPVCCGVPQGSVLGPILFSLYLLPLGAIFEKYNIAFHCYADDIQIYFELTDDLAVSLHYFQECMREVKEWFLSNSLVLNDKKTEIVVFNSKIPRARLCAALGSFANFSCDYVSNLGVLLDSSLKLDKQVSAVVRSSFHQLRLISKARHYVPHEDLEKLIHAFVTSRLDYCNSLYYGLPSSLLLRLQTVQNAAAHLLTGTRKFCPITPVLASLHWLPIRYRIQFKILLLTFKTINKLAPSYLSELLKPHTPARTLRSATQQLLIQPRSRLKSRGDRAFALAAPVLWNTLPLDLRASDSIALFKSRLKTHLFNLAFPSS